MGRPLEWLILSESERAELEALAARRKTAQALALRARIVLLAGEGIANKEVAARLGIDPATVGKGRRRFLTDRARTTAPATARPRSLLPSAPPRAASLAGATRAIARASSAASWTRLKKRCRATSPCIS